ncbi:MAG: tetratricopeptide repeat protein, partial [Bryobacteraceae bacterium]
MKWFRLGCLILFFAAAPLLRAQDANGEAVAALKSGRLHTAESVLRAHLKAEPRDLVSVQLLAIVLDKEKKYAEADPFYRQALAAGPHSPGLLNNYGNHLLAMSKAAQAQKAFSQTLHLQPENANALYGLAVADIALHERQPALALLVRARKQAPQRRDVAALLARTTASLGYFADAIAAWDAYLKLAPQDQTARRERAFAESAIGKNKQAALAEL